MNRIRNRHDLVCMCAHNSSVFSLFSALRVAVSVRFAIRIHFWNFSKSTQSKFELPMLSGGPIKRRLYLPRVWPQLTSAAWHATVLEIKTVEWIRSSKELIARSPYELHFEKRNSDPTKWRNDSASSFGRLMCAALPRTPSNNSIHWICQCCIQSHPTDRNEGVEKDVKIEIAIFGSSNKFTASHSATYAWPGINLNTCLLFCYYLISQSSPALCECVLCVRTLSMAKPNQPKRTTPHYYCIHSVEWNLIFCSPSPLSLSHSRRFQVSMAQTAATN